MTRCRSRVDSATFDDALHLYPTVKLLPKTMLPSFVMLESLLPPSKLFTLVPMPAKHLQKMLQDSNQLTVLPVMPGLCSPLTYGQMLVL